MVKKHDRGDILQAWIDKRSITLTAFASRVGQTPAGQVGKFICGARDLPIQSAILVSKETGIPLKKLLSAEQFDAAKGVFALMARDAAA